MIEGAVDVNISIEISNVNEKTHIGYLRVPTKKFKWYIDKTPDRLFVPDISLEKNYKSVSILSWKLCKII